MEKGKSHFTWSVVKFQTGFLCGRAYGCAIFSDSVNCRIENIVNLGTRQKIYVKIPADKNTLTLIIPILPPTASPRDMAGLM